MIAGIAGVVEQRRLGAERHLAVVVGAVAFAAELGDRAVAVRVESRHRRQRVELDMRVGGDLAHLRQEAVRVRLDLGEQLVGIVERQMANLEVERAVARHDVERGAAVDHAGVHGRERHVVGGVERAVVAKRARHVR